MHRGPSWRRTRMRLALWMRCLVLLIVVVGQTQGATYTISVLQYYNAGDVGLEAEKVALETAVKDINADTSLLSGHTLALFIQGYDDTVNSLMTGTTDLICNNTIAGSVVCPSGLL